MNTTTRIAIVAGLLIALAGVFLLKNADKDAPPSPTDTPVQASLPRLVDLGSDVCVACKTMKPVLEGLKRDFADTFHTEFINVRTQPEAKQRYQVKLIPTQIFFDASGQELFRHTGFMSRDDILARWRELGIQLPPPSPEPQGK